jgi:hypothetical protein
LVRGQLAHGHSLRQINRRGRHIFRRVAAHFLADLSPREKESRSIFGFFVALKKKIITEKEAESVREDLSKGDPPPVAPTVNSGDKWKLSTPITEIELYGDARLRYEYRGGSGGSIGINPLDDYQLFQADLNLKF